MSLQPRRDSTEAAVCGSLPTSAPRSWQQAKVPDPYRWIASTAGASRASLRA
ncbi:hypothetical protein L0F81_27570 [Streptomyces tricolor]|uniref:Uncharacterized protein n=1 Tax=Streptomyces tricolor TaxID=68277 RepID=A0ABS9JN25_9ACTN|nr:hypothetical protein [Streptomyces tricolor]MCG0066979.1 hypothetical protein [Streptomyces tricolor]